MRQIKTDVGTIQALVGCQIIVLVDDQIEPLTVEEARQRVIKDQPVNALAMSGLKLEVSVVQAEPDREEWVLVPINN